MNWEKGMSGSSGLAGPQTNEAGEWIGPVCFGCIPQMFSMNEEEKEEYGRLVKERIPISYFIKKIKDKYK